jgi:hypothetical protein
VKNKKKMLRKLFGPEIDEVSRDWIELHSVEVNSLYSLHNAVSVRDEMGGILKGGNHL